MKRGAPIHHHMSDDAWYRQLDPGIRFAVRVLHARGFETAQSCQGGKGHCYDHPTIDLVAGEGEARGFGAVSALADYGLPVDSVALFWRVWDGMPSEKLWRITFHRSMEDRANEKPIFVFGHIAA